MNKIAVLIPCYNEHNTIAKVISDCKKAIPEATIYVYDNNSTDGTAEVAKHAGALVKHEPRQGKGNVVRSMFHDIIADCYLMVDGDDTYSLDNAAKMCDKILIDGYDMVIGDRLSSNYFAENKRIFHGIGNRLVRYLINLIFRSNIKDIMTGYRAFSNDFVKNTPITCNGFEVETEMTIHALDKNFKVTEIPIIYRERGEGSNSKLSTISDGIKVIKTIFSLFRDYRPLSFFSILCMLCLFMAIIMDVPIFIDYLHSGLVPRFPTLIVSGVIATIGVIFLFCGIVLDTIAKKHRQVFELLRYRH